MMGQGISLLMACLVAGPLAGQSLPATQARVLLAGNVHHAVLDGFPIDRADSSLAMDRMILSFTMRSEAQAALEHLLMDQQDPGSPRYHQWLTPEQFAASFGPTPEERAKVVAWLQSQGFTIDEVARGGMSITFSGNAGQVEQAFRTPIMEYQIQGELRHANATDPSIPAELAGLVGGVVTLHNIPRQAMHTAIRALTAEERARLDGAKPDYTSSTGSHYLTPGDFATIYDLNPLYTAGIDGTGVTIAIVGRTNPGTTNWSSFRSKMGLTANTPAIILAGANPGDLGKDEDGEADLDAEWSGAVAKKATIDFVCSASSGSTDGVDLAATYIVNQRLAPVLSTSFGSCESAMGTTENAFFNNLWKQAAAQGMSAFVAAGDAGASGCSGGADTTGTGRAVNGLGSTPYNVAVGGTMFQEGSGTYWTALNNSATQASVISYIPEVAWNEGSFNGGTGLWATGGGVSTVYAKPSWQATTGVPGDGMRDVPDVSLSAAAHDGYMLQSQGQTWIASGTSAASPAFAGIMALVVQKTGVWQGNPNPTLYAKATAQFAGGPAIFHDITSGNNTVTGTVGYSAGSGYDLVTGLGSVDGALLVGNWGGVSISSATGSVGLLTGSTATLTFSMTGTSSGSIAWSTSGGTLTAGTCSKAGSSGVTTCSATFSASAAGSYTITGTASVSPNPAATITVNVHDAHLTGTGSTVTGMDVLTLLGSYGTSSTACDLNGDGVVDGSDLNQLVTLLGW